MKIVNRTRGGVYLSPNQTIGVHSKLNQSDSFHWKLNKSTATNGIATWNDLPGSYVNKVGKTGNQCPKIEDIRNATDSDYQFIYPLINIGENKKLAVYSNCSWKKKSNEYTITFSGFESFGAIYLANDSTLPGSNEFSRFGLSTTTLSWIDTEGLTVNNSATASGNVNVFPGATVYIFRYINSKYNKIDQFVLENGNQTVTY